MAMSSRNSTLAMGMPDCKVCTAVDTALSMSGKEQAAAIVWMGWLRIVVHNKGQREGCPLLSLDNEGSFLLLPISVPYVSCSAKTRHFPYFIKNEILTLTVTLASYGTFYTSPSNI